MVFFKVHTLLAFCLNLGDLVILVPSSFGSLGPCGFVLHVINNVLILINLN